MKRSRRSDSSSRRSESSRNAPSPSPDRWGTRNGIANGGGNNMRNSRYGTSSGSLASLVLEGEELTYITRLKEILEAFPNKGPPYEPSQLCPHVFIGSQRNADDYGLLRRLGITHVLNLCANRKLSLHLNPYPRITGIFRYVAFPAEDQSDYRILKHLPDAVDFLEHCKKNKGRALVHCNLGINRSGAICASYLMLDQQMPLLKVCELLKKKRGVVLTNKGFRRQLVKFATAHHLLDRVIEPKQHYMDRCGSISTLSGYPEHSTDIPPGELATSRPILSSRSHQRSQSMGGGRNVYRPTTPGLGSSFPPIQESQSAPATPTRYHPAYCTLPRGSREPPHSRSLQPLQESPSSNKRAIAASHYEQDYFMDTIPEDHHAPGGRSSNSYHPREADTANSREQVFTPPSRAYLTSLPKLSGSSSSRDRDRDRDRDKNSRDRDRDKKNKKKEKESSSSKNIPQAAATGDEDFSEWVVSSTRPLRIYKRATTDSVLYQKPMNTYRRADTVGTTDNLSTGMDNMSLQDPAEHGGGRLTEKHRSSSRTSLSSLTSFSASGFFNKLRSRSRLSLQNF